MIWTIPKMWDGGSCWIIGGGHSMPRQFNIPENVIQDVCTGRLFPDAYSPFLEALHDKHIIGVNNAYQIGTWIDALFFGDSSWYLKHRRKLASWPGLKVTVNPKFANLSREKMEGVKYLRKDTNHPKGISPRKDKISWNGNSGAAAISLAAHLGVKQIYLLGFDMCSENHTHWHGNHGKNVKRLPYKRHLKGFPAIAMDAENMGIEIFNVNMNSKIGSFSKITLEEALQNVNTNSHT